MIFSEYPFLRYVIFLTLGILFYPVVAHLDSAWWLYGLGLTFTLYFILILINEKSREFQHRVSLPLLAMLQLLFLGLIVAERNDISKKSNHLVNFRAPIFAYTAQVQGQDEPKPNSVANSLKMKSILTQDGWQSVEGEVLIYHRSKESLQAGDFLLVKGSPQEIQEPAVPFEFDYRRFMRRQKISHQHFVGDNFEVIGKVKDQPIHTFFIQIRSVVMKQLESKILDPKASQVAKALLLGQKKNLEKDISDAYSTAGAMHILAVSGLHVGIIYGFFFLFVKPYRLKKSNRVIYLSLIIVLIWAYAMLTGMSPSVMRAATMFTLMALAQMKSRSPSIFNAISLSAFILLIFDPDLIYAVGFQLSYIALIGILLFQPVLVRLWMPKHAVLEYMWQISTVGIAAQLATFPISAYYFHTFPVYFILSNLVAIPGAFLIMCFGVPFMLLSKVPLISDALAWPTEKAILLVNKSVFWIQELPFSKIDEIYIPGASVFFYWLILAMLFLGLIYRKSAFYHFGAGLLFVFLLIRAYWIIEAQQRKELIVYGVQKGYAVDFWIRKDLYHSMEIEDSELTFKITPYRKTMEIEKMYPLTIVSQDSMQKIVLPADLGFIELSKGSVGFQGLANNQSYIWEGGKWQPYTQGDSLYLGVGQKTYKFVF
ncbi:ComEC/Rec2 family competence protein [Mongoliibacter ruber]|uniref:Competence protein ComEC n=1 Tax=Mongoliibacter ruber TaxID=1750599 RepID=A0A2T0WEM4_9BACT|nr:ComEC/Rec2 family competence protein [Mongoliibacter ruber]PRY84974.1 competence protein ComEC [Mongoliibacter ruber]